MTFNSKYLNKKVIKRRFLIGFCKTVELLSCSIMLRVLPCTAAITLKMLWMLWFYPFI